MIFGANSSGTRSGQQTTKKACSSSFSSFFSPFSPSCPFSSEASASSSLSSFLFPLCSPSCLIPSLLLLLSPFSFVCCPFSLPSNFMSLLFLPSPFSLTGQEYIFRFRIGMRRKGESDGMHRGPPLWWWRCCQCRVLLLLLPPR